MASYRDDRDALRAKADVLEGELAGTKADLDAAAKEIDAKDAEIARLRRLAGERAPTTGGHKGALLACVTVACVVLGAVAAFTMTRSRAQVAVVSQPPQIALTQVTAPPADVRRTGTLHNLLLSGHVVKVEGRSDVKVGDACTLLALVRGVDAEEAFEDVFVKCGSTELYRLSNSAGTVSSATRGNLEPNVGDTFEPYALRFEDVGVRTSDARPQIKIDTSARTARVFHDGAVRSEVLLEVDAGGMAVKAH